MNFPFDLDGITLRGNEGEGSVCIPDRTLTREEVALHNGRGRPEIYVILFGVVYDLTPAAKLYGPGAPYDTFAGRDATRGLATFHLGLKDDSGDYSNYSEKHMTNAKRWEALYRSKYKIIGRVEEKQKEGALVNTGPVKTAFPTSNHTAVQGNSAAVQSNHLAIQSNFAAVQSNSAAVQSNSAAVQGNSAAFQSNHSAIQSNSAAVKSNSAAVQGNPMTDLSNPASAQEASVSNYRAFERKHSQKANYVVKVETENSNKNKSGPAVKVSDKNKSETSKQSQKTSKETSSKLCVII